MAPWTLWATMKPTDWMQTHETDYNSVESGIINLLNYQYTNIRQIVK